MRRILDDQYELLQNLESADGVAQHYGWDRRAQRPVSVTEIAAARQTATAAAGRFAGELTAIAALDHPGIMPVYALRRGPDATVFVIHPFIDGLDLAAILSRLSRLGKSLPEGLAVHLLGRIVSALDYAHRVGGGDRGQPVIHGLLRPSWVLVGIQGTVVIRGFVEGRLLGGASAPAAGASAAGDLAAAAWILYEMLTGLAPFEGDGGTLYGAGASLGDEGVTALKRAGCSSAVRSILGTALYREAGLRYPSAASMLEDVQRVSRVSAESAQSGLADVVQGLLSDEEVESRRRLAALRGSPIGAAPGALITTSDLLESVDWSLPAVGGPRSDVAVDETTAVSGVPPDRREGATRIARLDALLAEHAPAQPARRAPMRRVWSYVLPLVVLAAIVWIIMVWWRGVRPPDRDMSPQVDGRQISEHALQTIPSGALVFINDSAVGATPFECTDFEPGPLRLRFEYPGFAPVETVLVVRADAPLPTFPPFVFRGTLSFSSVPPGAHPIVNGRLLRDFEALAYDVAASETLQVAFDLHGERSPSMAWFNPAEGFLSPTDTTLWRWRPGNDQGVLEVIGVFARTVHMRSEPDDALIFIDGDSIPIGRTNASVDLPYGEHTVLLQRPPFLDYRFTFTVAGETPDLYAPVLKRTVRLAAVDPTDPAIDLKALVTWIRCDGVYIRTPEDNLMTPYSLQLDGRTHELHFRREGYADTTVTLPGTASNMRVALRRLARGEAAEDDVAMGSVVRWVRFAVEAERGQAVVGAEVIGVEKDRGDTVRYGPTDASGIVVVPVPVGDYEWEAVRDGFVGRADTERIRPGDETKRMTLRLKPR